MNLKNIISEELSKMDVNILYHGSPYPNNFDNRGDVYDGTFFSTNKNEAKSYGKFLYKVQLKNGLKLFDTNNLNDVKILYNEFTVLYDYYFDEDDDEHYIKSPNELYDHSDSWNAIENTDGVLDWMNGNYDGVWIYEGGVRNLLLFNPINKKLQSIDLIS
jgi:hypothetical protein